MNVADKNLTQPIRNLAQRALNIDAQTADLITLIHLKANAQIDTLANENLNEILSVAVRWFGIADTLDLIDTAASLRRAREQSFNIPPMGNPDEN